MPHTRRVLSLSIVLFSAAAISQADSIYIDFGSFNPAPSSSFAAAATLGGSWNKIMNTGLTSNLLNVNGVATATTLSLIADDPSGSQTVGSGNTEDLRGDNFFASPGDSWSVTINNLANGTYTFFYYGPTNTAVTTGPFTVNGIAVPGVTGSLTDNLVQGTDWDVLANVSVTSGTLTVVSTSTDGFHGLAGLQLVDQSVSSVPEPSTLVLLGTMLGAGAILRRLKQNPDR